MTLREFLWLVAVVSLAMAAELRVTQDVARVLFEPLARLI